MLETRLYNLFFLKIKEDYKYLFRVFIIIFIISIAISFFVPKRYTSTLSIMPNQSENSISSLGMLAQDFGISGGNTSSFPIAELAVSNSILDKIYSMSFDLDGNQGQTSITKILKINKKSIISNIFGNKDSENKLLIKYLTIEQLKERLVINYDRKTNVTSISVTIEDPLVAKQILQAFYDELSIFINQSVNDAASMKKDFIEKRLLVVQSELSADEQLLEKFLNENKSIADSPILLKKYNEIKREVVVKESAYLILKKELEIAKIDEIKNTLKIFIIQKPEKSVVKSYPSRLSFALTISSLAVVCIFLFRRKNDIYTILEIINE